MGISAAKADMLLTRSLVAQGNGGQACKHIYCLLKLWSAHCRETAADGPIAEQGRQLDTIAEQVKRAEAVLARHSPAANAKARTLQPTTSRLCASEIWTDMALRAAMEPRDNIRDDIKNALSFLHTDPEVKLVIEAHQILQHAHGIFDACMRHPTVLNHCCIDGCCCFALAVQDDFESLYSAGASRL